VSAQFQFNVLTLHPKDPESFPDGLLDAIMNHTAMSALDPIHEHHSDSMESRLRLQMRTDALQPLAAIENSESITKAMTAADQYSSEVIEAVHFLRLNVSPKSPPGYSDVLILLWFI
jgi:hypothetical protein